MGFKAEVKIQFTKETKDRSKLEFLSIQPQYSKPPQSPIAIASHINTPSS